MRRALAFFTVSCGLLAASVMMSQDAHAQSRALPCFADARAFGEAVTANGNLQQDITNPSPQLEAATELRNRGMVACNAGRIKEGRAMIRQATDMLKQKG